MNILQEEVNKICFELISNELLSDALEYLLSVDLFHGFQDLYIRFDNLLIEYFQICKVN